jgi:flagellar basal body-associated protein FliL
VSGAVVAVIVIVVVALVAGAVVFVFVGRDEPEPPPPVPTSEPPVSPSPIPVGTPIETPEAPPATLTDILPPTVGQFSLQNAAPDPQSVAAFGATDAIVANYVRGDGTLIIHNLLAYPTRIEADIAKAQLVDNLLFHLGYRRAGSLRRGNINATRLVGADEVVVWSHRELLAALEGPFGLTAGFFLVLPY